MSHFGVSEEFEGDRGAGFGVGEGVVVIQEGVAAGGSDGVELMVGKAAAEVAAGGGEGIQEAVAGIVQAVGTENGFEASFVEAGIVSDEGNIGRETVGFKGGQDAVFYLVPDIREEWCVFCIIGAEAVDLLAEPGVVVRVGMNQAIERVHHVPTAHDDDAHGADAAGAAVGGFEVYDYSMVHSTTLTFSRYFSLVVLISDANLRLFFVDLELEQRLGTSKN